MNKKYKTKVHSLRMTPEKIEQFNNACQSLPVTFKPNQLLLNYIDYIIATSDEFKKTGNIKLGFIFYDKNIILCNLEGRQTSIDFEEGFNVNEE